MDPFFHWNSPKKKFLGGLTSFHLIATISVTTTMNQKRVKISLCTFLRLPVLQHFRHWSFLSFENPLQTFGVFLVLRTHCRHSGSSWF